MKNKIFMLAIGLSSAIALTVAFPAISFSKDSKSKNSVTKKQERTVAQEFSVVVEDVVFRLEPNQNGYSVAFRLHAGIYSLRSGSKYYRQILDLLDSSKKTQERIKLRVDANTMEIEEVVVKTK